MVKPWRTLATRTVAKTPIFQLDAHRRVSEHSGREGEFVTLSCADWVNVVAITPADEVVLIEQFRHGTARSTLEIPGGMVDPGDRDPAVAAARELREETGYVAKTLVHLGTVEPNPAIMGNLCHTFLAEGAERTAEVELDAHEEIEVLTVPAGELEALVRAGRIRHAMVISALHFWELHRRG